MFKYTCLNPIAEVGLNKFSADYEKTDNINEAQGVLVRSASMHDMELPDELLCVARAGAGVNNIPLDECAGKGIVVFNTPGANANGVKELVIAGMLIASRDVQSKKQFFPIFLRPPGRLTCVRFEQPKKTLSPSSLTSDEMVTFFN